MSSLCKIDPSIFSLTHSHFFPSPLSSQRLSLAGLDRTKAPPLPSSAGADALPLGRRGQAKASTGGDPTCEQRDAKVWQRQFAVPPWMCSSSIEACSWTEMYGDGLWGLDWIQNLLGFQAYRSQFNNLMMYGFVFGLRCVVYGV